MSFGYKAIFVDLDGTLLNSQKEISKKNLDCLNSFIEQGIYVVIATGRTIKSVNKVTENLNINTPIITLNGSDVRKSRDGYSMSLVYLENKYRDSIYARCKSILNGNKQYSIQNLLVDTSKGFYCLHPNKIDVDEFTSHYDTEVLELDLDNPPDEQVISFLFLLTPESNRVAFLKDQNDYFMSRVQFCTFNGWPWIEVGSLNANKGSAMTLVCEHLGIEVKDVIAFGDGQNDVEMLKSAGLGVAMGNADEHAIKCANAKTVSNDADGVAVFLERLYNVSK
ncbi:Cof-type HAD-IIB family hydrolase [Fluviispira multicolorata]|uniref:Cof-type HAD-IIB family hydrolase n=1 Tax=Fluviispira multicolorata TaxID=2654512 RepID=A0A833JDK1_9BACT|nr:Cof-type HAD-IIB family hydrolase [Fluviispira multicolorata]KAB8028612.1 Cof-type HAD-IIB family hydrolase [Fluviispira multicolorata]